MNSLRSKPQFISLYPARDILNVDSDILVNFRLRMHVLHNCTSCKYCPSSAMSRLRMGERSMTEIEICWLGNAFIFITSCDDAACLALNKTNAENVKALVDAKLAAINANSTELNTAVECSEQYANRHAYK